MYSDALCHLEDPRIGDAQAAVDAARGAGVIHLVWADADPLRPWPRVKVPAGLRFSIARGLHPGFIEGDGRAQLAEVKKALDEEEADAVGEIGLDHRPEQTDRRVQEHCFRTQLDWAVEYDLPAVLHVVRAHEEILAAVRAAGTVRGYVHGFRKSAALAQRYVDAGLRVSFGWPLVGPRGAALRAVAASLPHDRVVLETDAPEEVGVRTLRPVDVLDVTAALAQAWGRSVPDTAAQVSANLAALFDR